MTTSTDTITHYFTLAAAPDLEAYFAQFAPDAVVEDDGHEYHGIEELRGWRTTVPPVSYDVLDIGTDGDVVVVRADISGDFPGSPVVLTFRFGLDADGLITTLSIRA
jgi:hypothetical protein